MNAIAASATHNRDAEESILGGILLRNEVLDRLPDLEPSHFFNTRHQHVFSSFRNLRANGRPIDLVTVENELERHGRLDAIGGVGFLGQLVLRVPTLENVVAYAEDVQRLHRKRELAAALDAARLRALEADTEPDEIASEAIAALSATSTRRVRWNTADGLVAEIRQRSKDPWVPLMLGRETIAEVPIGEMPVVLGPTGSGKTSLVIGMLIAHARESGLSIFVSREMPARLVAARAIGMQCDASWRDVLRGAVSDSEMRRALPDRFVVLDGDAATVCDLDRAVSLLRQEHGEDLPILAAVDYVQIMPSSARDPRMRVSEVIESLSRWSQRSRVTVIVISQTSRAAARALRSGEATGADTIDSGAESSSIERAAHVLFAVGSAGPEHDDGTKAVDLSISKHRMGEGDRVVPMTFNGRIGRWRIAGEARPAAEVRAERATEKDVKRSLNLRNAARGAITGAAQPLTMNELCKEVAGRRADISQAVKELLTDPESDVVQVYPANRGSYPVWSRARAVAQGKRVRDADE